MAICEPSGLHEEPPTLPLVFVTCVCPDPSAFMTNSWKFPLRLLSKAIFVPSGEKVGCVFTPVDVSWRGLLPSPLIAQIWLVPLASLW